MSAQTPVWVTAQALLAFARAPFPLARSPGAPRRAARRRRPARRGRRRRGARPPAPGEAGAPRAGLRRPASAGLAPAEVLALARAAGAAAAVIMGRVR